MDKQQLLDELMQLDFARYDLRLYLNTHPNDNKALSEYNMLSARASEVRGMYVNNYGPLSQMDETPMHEFTWSEDPWPWME